MNLFPAHRVLLQALAPVIILFVELPPPKKKKSLHRIISSGKAPLLTEHTWITLGTKRSMRNSCGRWELWRLRPSPVYLSWSESPKHFLTPASLLLRPDSPSFSLFPHPPNFLYPSTPLDFPQFPQDGDGWAYKVWTRTRRDRSDMPTVEDTPLSRVVFIHKLTCACAHGHGHH